MDSKVYPIRANESPAKPIIRPGGIIHHHNPSVVALAALASLRILPQVGIVISLNPRKLKPASARIAAGTEYAIMTKIKGSSWGTICLNIIFISDSPINLEASTYW